MVNITIDKKTSRVYYYIINLQEGIFRDMTQTNCMNKSSFANAGNPGFYPCAHITYIIEDRADESARVKEEAVNLPRSISKVLQRLLFFQLLKYQLDG